MHGIHGIRWVASMRNILAKVYKMLHIIVMDLDIRAKEKFGCASHTIHGRRDVRGRAIQAKWRDVQISSFGNGTNR